MKLNKNHNVPFGTKLLDYLLNIKHSKKMKENYIKQNINNITFNILKISFVGEYGDYYTILHYLCDKGMIKSLKLLIYTLNLEAKHFQIKNISGDTALYYLCHNKLSSIIILLNNWDPKYLMNTKKYRSTELYELCYNKMFYVIEKITNKFANGLSWSPNHFQNIGGRGKTELGLMCENKASYIIKIISNNFKKGVNWEPKHFQNCDHNKKTELYNLCENNDIATILSIKGWRPYHFFNPCEDARGNYKANHDELFWLCENRMGKVINSIVGWKYTKYMPKNISYMIEIGAFDKPSLNNNNMEEEKLNVEKLILFDKFDEFDEFEEYDNICKSINNLNKKNTSNKFYKIIIIKKV